MSDNIDVKLVLDRQNFEQDMKDLDKYLKDFQNNFRQSNTLANNLSRNLKDIAKEVNKMQGFGNVTRELNSINTDTQRMYTNMRNINGEIQQLRNNLNSATQLNMGDLGRLSNIINSVRDTNLINTQNLDVAINRLQQIQQLLPNNGNVQNAVSNATQLHSNASGGGASAIAAGGVLGNLARNGLGSMASSGAGGAVGGMVAGAGGGLAAALGGPAGIAALAGITAYVGALAGLIGIMKESIGVAAEFQKAMNGFATSMGATYDEYKQFGEDIRKGFGQQGFTQDIQEYGKVLGIIEKKYKLTGKAAIDFSKDMLAVSQNTGYGIEEIYKAQDSLMKNFNMTADQSLDMINNLYQQTGDKAGDLIDTLNEYPTQFKQSGMSAEYFYKAMIASGNAGMMNLDKAADSLKEFGIKLAETAPNDDYLNAWNKLGINVDKIRGEFQKGGDSATKAMDEVTKKISGIQDQATKRSIITALFGTPGEDAGTKFIDELAKVDVKLADIWGSADKTRQILEGNFETQMKLFGNMFTDIKEMIGEKLLPIVQPVLQGLADNFETIQTKVEEHIVPAFFFLAEAIAYALGIDDFTKSAVDNIDNITSAVGGVIKFMAYTVIAIRKAYDIVKIFALGFVNGLAAIGAGLDVIITGAVGLALYIERALNFLVLGYTGFYEGIIRGADNAWGLIGDIFKNGGKGIVELFSWAAKSAFNKLVDFLINPFIDAYNNTIGSIPGSPTLNRVGFVNVGSIPTQYKANVQGILDAFGKDNVSWNTMKSFESSMSNAQQKVGETGYKILESLTGTMQNLSGEIIETGKDLFKGTGDIDKMVDDWQKKVKDTMKDVKTPPKGPKPTGGNGTGTDLSGHNKTKEDEAAAKKAADDAKKAEAEALKNKQDYYKNLIAAEKKMQEQMIKIDMDAAEKRWAVMGDTKERYEDEIKTYAKIKSTYKLTTDQMIDYTKKQYDAEVKIRDLALDNFKKVCDKEVKAKQDANNKLIDIEKAKQQKIDDEINQRSIENTKEDMQKEIDDLQKEYDKYKDGRSAETIAHAQEIKKELDRKLLEQQRYNKQLELEQQKTESERKVEQLEKENDEVQKKYEDLYTELEETVNNKEAFLAKVREKAADDANANIKKSLDTLVTDYKNAYDEMQKYTLSNTDVQNLNIIDAKRNWSEGSLTGDTGMQQEAAATAQMSRQLGGTIGQDYDMTGQNWGVNGSMDYQYFVSNGKRWTELEKQKKGASAERLLEIQAEQAKLHEANNILRRKYGITNNTDPIPMYPKFHTGGIAAGDYMSVLQKGEMVLTESQQKGLWKLINSIMNFGMMPAIQSGMAIAGGTTVNYNAPVVGVMNNYNTGDVDQAVQNINMAVQYRGRANGIK